MGCPPRIARCERCEIAGGRDNNPAVPSSDTRTPSRIPPWRHLVRAVTCDGISWPRKSAIRPAPMRRQWPLQWAGQGDRRRTSLPRWIQLPRTRRRCAGAGSCRRPPPHTQFQSAPPGALAPPFPPGRISVRMATPASVNPVGIVRPGDTNAEARHQLQTPKHTPPHDNGCRNYRAHGSSQDQAD